MASAEPTRTDPAATPALGASRGRVLQALRDAPEPVGVADLAAQLGLHPNTCRFHLDGLIAAGLVERRDEARSAPGRPRKVYTATQGAAQLGQRSYRLLAEMATSYLAGRATDPTKVGLEAGESWGHFLGSRPPPFQRVDVATATSLFLDALEKIGFAPEAATVRRRPRVLLHHCPFREVAERHGELVCSMHLGLMRGLLAEMQAPLRVDRLDPLVEPGLCVTHLSRIPDPPSGAPAPAPAPARTAS